MDSIAKNHNNLGCLSLLTAGEAVYLVHLVCLVYLVGGEEGETSEIDETGPVSLVCRLELFL